MKRTLSMSGLLLMVVVLATGLIQAEDAKSFVVSIPFEFQVSKETLPAGQYEFQIDRVGAGTSLGSRLVLRSTDGKINVLVATVPGRLPRSGKPGVSFRKYEQTYFLGQVNTLQGTCQVVQSPAEKQLAARIKSERSDVTRQAE